MTPEIRKWLLEKAESDLRAMRSHLAEMDRVLLEMRRRAAEWERNVWEPEVTNYTVVVENTAKKVTELEMVCRQLGE